MNDSAETALRYIVEGSPQIEAEAALAALVEAGVLPLPNLSKIFYLLQYHRSVASSQLAAKDDDLDEISSLCSLLDESPDAGGSANYSS